MSEDWWADAYVRSLKVVPGPLLRRGGRTMGAQESEVVIRELLDYVASRAPSPRELALVEAARGVASSGSDERYQRLRAALAAYEEGS